MSVSSIHSGRWRIGFEASGAGEPVILIHSSVSGRQQWRSLTGELASRFQVVAVDLPGRARLPVDLRPRRARLRP